MSVEVVQFMPQLLNLFMFIQRFTCVKFAERNAVDSERTLIFLLSLRKVIRGFSDNVCSTVKEFIVQ